MNETLIELAIPRLSPPGSGFLLAQVQEEVSAAGTFLSETASRFADFVPGLLGAIAILIIGWIVATVAAAAVKGILNRTQLDNRIANWITGSDENSKSPPIEKWASTAIYWLIMAFVIVAFLQALNLQVVSEPLNDFLGTIFEYLPRIGGALLLLGAAWLLATIAKMVLTRLLGRFNLDDRLASASGTSDSSRTSTTAPGDTVPGSTAPGSTVPGSTVEGRTTETGSSDSPFLVNETLGNAVYWFVLLFFLPLILDVLGLQGPLQPVQNLLDDILSVLPKVLAAGIIAVVGWFVARVVRGIVTNLAAAAGADRLGARFGLNPSTTDGTGLSSIIGTVVYVLILIPTAIAALNELQISAISDPAIEMLELILVIIPRIFAAGVIIGVFYFIGQFISELVTSLLTSIGFNNIFRWLGLPQLQDSIGQSSTQPPPPSEIGEPQPYVRPEDSQTPSTRTPSEVLGLISLVAIVLVGAVAATEVLQFEELTTIVQAVLGISLRVLSGVVVFGVGLYLANLAFNLITNSGSGQARILGQAARIAIIALVSAMALQQMGIAPNIVNLAFGLLLGSLAVAIAIAFGLGGRDIASEQIREWLGAFRSRQ